MIIGNEESRSRNLFGIDLDRFMREKIIGLPVVARRCEKCNMIFTNKLWCPNCEPKDV